MEGKKNFSSPNLGFFVSECRKFAFFLSSSSAGFYFILLVQYKRISLSLSLFLSFFFLHPEGKRQEKEREDKKEEEERKSVFCPRQERSNFAPSTLAFLLLLLLLPEVRGKKMLLSLIHNNNSSSSSSNNSQQFNTKRNISLAKLFVCLQLRILLQETVLQSLKSNLGENLERLQNHLGLPLSICKAT